MYMYVCVWVLLIANNHARQLSMEAAIIPVLLLLCRFREHQISSNWPTKTVVDIIVKMHHISLFSTLFVHYDRYWRMAVINHKLRLPQVCK